MEIVTGERFQISPCVIAIIIDEYCNENKTTKPSDIIVFGDIYIKNPGIYIFDKNKLTNLKNWYFEKGEEYDWMYHMQIPEETTPKQYILKMLEILCEKQDEQIVIKVNV